MLAHVVQRRLVNHVIGEAGAQQLEEVHSAFATGGAEPGEAVVADLRADGVGTAVARAGVVHRDPICRFQPCPQHLPVLNEEIILPMDQQPHGLAFGNAGADRLQLGHQPLHGKRPLTTAV